MSFVQVHRCVKHSLLLSKPAVCDLVNMLTWPSYFPSFLSPSLSPGVGGEFRASEDERQLAAGQPNRPQPVPALRLPVLPPLLLQAHRPVPQGRPQTRMLLLHICAAPKHQCDCTAAMISFIHVCEAEPICCSVSVRMNSIFTALQARVGRRDNAVQKS